MSAMAICAVGDYNARPFDVQLTKIVLDQEGARMEKQVDEVSQERARQSRERERQLKERERKSDVNEKILNIKAILDESGEFMDDNEKQAMRKKLFELRMQCIKDGEGGSGV